MLRLILRRVLISVPLVFIVSLATFLLQALAPGDTVRVILGANYTPEGYAALRHQLGFDRPLPEQYWQWLVNALHGDLGVSPVSGLPVGTVLADRLGVTLSLIIVTTLVAAILGVGLGTVSAVRGGALARMVDVLSLAGFALPGFWLGLVLITLFAVLLRLLPVSGYVPLTASPGEWIRSLILPVTALAVHAVAVIAKQTRDGMLNALGQPFVHSLRARGVSERSVLFRHALRNAAIPVVTVVGWVFVSMLSGTVLVEQVFAMPGLGGLAVESTSQHDLPMLQGVAVVFTVVVVAANLIVDLTYGWLNPKVRVQ